jgi:asparaginyl-tRNA synthetase
MGGGVSPLLSSSCSSSLTSSHQLVTMTMMRRSVKNTRLSTTSGRSAAGENSSTTQTTTTYKRRDRLAQIKGNDRGKSKVGKTLELKGWVRSNRAQKDRAFIDLNDGSDMSGMQMVVLQEHVDESVWQLVAGATSEVSTGASIRVKGKVVESPGGKQSVEVLVDELEIIGKADPATYPLQKKRHTLEYLRGIAHLRPRTNTIAAVSRVRNQLAFATHQFFQQNGFLYVNTPIITASDCEGAGEQFQVTCLLNGLEEEGSAGAAASVAPQDVEKVEQKVKSQGDIVKKTKADKGEGNATKEDVDREVKKLLALKEELTELQSGSNTPQTSVKELPKLKSGGVDYEQDFFAKRSYLTVSGQLNGEIMASAVNDIYTFGPTFRAENSNTSRHLAEFWMVEPELAFADLNDDMDCAEAYLKHCITHVLKHCDEDLQFFEKNISKDNLRERLQNVVDQDFARITYTEAVEHVLSAKKKFEFPIQWGSDLQSEHERYISEEVYKDRPVIVRDYPKDIKAFYMRANDDGKTVAAMDVLVPKVGELMGGSQREERLDVLEKKIEEVGLEKESYWWYLELRKYGSVPHSGFGLGFERLVQYVTGVENIRDVIAFPRYPGSADF